MFIIMTPCNIHNAALLLIICFTDTGNNLSI